MVPIRLDAGGHAPARERQLHPSRPTIRRFSRPSLACEYPTKSTKKSSRSEACQSLFSWRSVPRESRCSSGRLLILGTPVMTGVGSTNCY